MKIRIENESINSFLDRVHLSKKKIYELKTNNKISGNFNSYDEKIDEVIDFNLDEEINYNPIKGSLDIIYEDDDYLVINKPRGIIIHDETNSLANIVANYYLENNIKSAIRFPSRLDRETTGVVIFCKNMISASYLDFLFANDGVDKKYISIAHGLFKDKKGTINFKIGTDRHNNNKMVTTPNGKPAKTIYNVLVNNSDISYLKIKIKTGRTHQIRVHLAKIGHPIYGDNIYGNDGKKYLMLHCNIISFKNYDGKKYEFTAKCDKEFDYVANCVL